MAMTTTTTTTTSFIFLARRSSLPSVFFPQRRRSIITCSSSSDTNGNPNSVPESVQPSPPPGAVEVRFRRRSRRQSRKQREDDDDDGSVRSTKAKVSERSPKKWEEMSFAEKAMELYVGEKGALFWLNKFAYASIFIMIGAWIVFRFVGPALNFYQLDSPPLSPSSVFSGSS